MIMRGYPMTDRELDAAYEAESARIWEQQQPTESRPIEQCDFEQLNSAHSALVVALSDFDSIENFIDEAMAAIHDTPESDKLASIINAALDLKVEAKRITDELYKRMFPKGVQ